MNLDHHQHFRPNNDDPYWASIDKFGTCQSVCLSIHHILLKSSYLSQMNIDHHQIFRIGSWWSPKACTCTQAHTGHETMHIPLGKEKIIISQTNEV